MRLIRTFLVIIYTDKQDIAGIIHKRLSIMPVLYLLYCCICRLVVLKFYYKCGLLCFCRQR